MTYVLPESIPDLERPFWNGLDADVLKFQRCVGCGYLRFPAAERCPECWQPGGEWTTVPTRGHVWSHTTYHKALHPKLRSAVPYTVALIQLTSGPQIPGRLRINGTTNSPRIGAEVHGVFVEVQPGRKILDWAIVQAP